MRLFKHAIITFLFFVSSTASFAQQTPNTAVEEFGELDVIIIHKLDNTPSEFHYYLRDAKGHGKRLYFDRSPNITSSGKKIRVKGHKKDSGIMVSELSVTGDASMTSTSTPLDAAVTEQKKAVVIVVNLSNANAVVSPATASAIMYTNPLNVNHAYKTASLDQLEFLSDTDGNGAPDVFGPFTINYDNSNCDYYGWAMAAESAAQAAGVNLSLYQHRVFVLPSYSNLPSCGWAGVANVGCSSFCRAWTAEGSLTVFVHELGHNLNLAHASTDPENDNIINSEYGDFSDFMGSSRSSLLLNSAHVDQKGWFAQSANSIITVTSSNQYTLYPIDLDPRLTPGPRILKIKKPNENKYYYVSYRQNLSPYKGLSTTYTQGANIHSYIGSGYGNTSFIKTLTNGAKFEDTANSITITQLGMASDLSTVTVSVNFEPLPCLPVTPAMTMTPSSVTAKAGESKLFSGIVTNTDPSTCPATLFTLAVSGDASVQKSISPTQAYLAPGQSSSFTLQATGSIDGNFFLQASAADLDQIVPNHNTGSIFSTLVIDSTPPSVPQNITASRAKGGKVQLDWSASTDGTGSGVASYQIYNTTSTGTELVGTSTTPSFSFRGVNGTTYLFTLKAVDNVGNISPASNQISLVFSDIKGNRKQ